MSPAKPKLKLTHVTLYSFRVVTFTAEAVPLIAIRLEFCYDLRPVFLLFKFDTCELGPVDILELSGCTGRI